MPLQKIIVSFSEEQLGWLEEQVLSSGLPRVEILRRALDVYREHVDTKRERALFSPEQVREVRGIARQRQQSERDVAKELVALGLRMCKNR